MTYPANFDEMNQVVFETLNYSWQKVGKKGRSKGY